MVITIAPRNEANVKKVGNTGQKRGGSLIKQEYNLHPNEAVIMKTDNISRDDGFKSYIYELTLTNLNLILVKKGAWREKVLDVLYFPVNSIRSYDGKASIILSKDKMYPKMEIHFQSGVEVISFEKRKEAELWVDNINRLLTGGELVPNNADNNAIPGTEFVAGTLKGTIDTFKGVFGIKSNSTAIVATEEAVIPERIVICDYCGEKTAITPRSAAKCRGCGAPIS